MVFPARLEMPGTTSELLHLFPVHLNTEGKKGGKEGGRETRSFVVGMCFFRVYVEQVQSVLELLSQPPLPRTPLHVCPAFQHHTGGGVGLGAIPVALAAFSTCCQPQFRNGCFEIEFLLFMRVFNKILKQLVWILFTVYTNEQWSKGRKKKEKKEKEAWNIHRLNRIIQNLTALSYDT